MSFKTHNVIFAVLMATTAPSMALAQVPSPNAPVRPGLALPPQPSSANLVQRQYDPLAAQQQPGVVYAPAPPQDEFFFVDENSPGPDNLAGGLSDYNTQRMNQAGAQLRGDYGQFSQQAALPAGTMQEAWSRPFDNMSAGQSAPGSIRYQWSSDLVMPVRLRAGMNTSVVLPEWEAAQDVLIGDGSAVEAKILRPNQVAVKSVQTGLDTSLTIIGGSGNVYTFYLRTEGRNTKLVTDLQVFVQAAPSNGSDDWFNGERLNAYAPTAAAVSADDAHPAMRTRENINLPAAASQGDEPVPVDRRIFDLRMFEVNEGDRIIAPEYAYTDGRFTYLHFPAGMTDRPAVFRIVDGMEGRVNTRVAGRHSEIIVVEALGDFVLRSGTRTVCIMQVDGENQVASN